MADSLQVIQLIPVQDDTRWEMNINLEIPEFNGSFQAKEVFPVDLLYSSTVVRSMEGSAQGKLS